MKKIPKPTLGVRKVFIDCIDTYREPLKQSLFDSIDIIEEAETDFETKKSSNELYQICRNVAVNDIVNTSVLKKVYTDKMVKKENPKGRVHYDAIFLSAPKGICPLCCQRVVGTLDHYLPKNNYPLLAVTPLNLIPACFDCNKGKQIDYPRSSQQETLHPYYDDVESFIWLKMKIIQLNPLKVEFYTRPPDHIPILLKQRIEGHFDSFKLNALYTTHAVQEYENNRLYLKRLYEKGGNDLVKSHLQDCYESRFNINKNSWQTAFYEGILKDITWYDELLI